MTGQRIEASAVGELPKLPSSLLNGTRQPRTTLIVCIDDQIDDGVIDCPVQTIATEPIQGRRGCTEHRAVSLDKSSGTILK